MIETGARSAGRVRRAAGLGAICAVMLAGAGCKTEEPFLVTGDINGAQVRFEQDRALADNIANRHCAQYERVARFIGGSADTGFYECDLR